MPRCCIMILLDGLGDRAHSDLAGKTPLQAAQTPFLDQLAQRGASGLLYPLRPGLQVPSENAHFAMFGYDQGEFPGRGYLEAAGAGLGLAPEDVAVLAHFVSLERRGDHLALLENRPCAQHEEEITLAAHVAHFTHNGIGLTYHRTRGLDGVVVMEGRVSPRITDSDPVAPGMPLIEVEPWLDADESAAKSAEALKAYLVWCHRRLAAHPVNRQRGERGAPPINGLVTQRAGRWRPVESFADRWGLHGLSISSGLVYWGLAAFLGMETVKVADGQDPGEDLADRLKAAMARSAECQFIHVHTKAPDVAGHSKDPRNKVAAIEALDRGIGAVLPELLADEEVVVVVTADHSTPSSGPLIHSGEPVPLTVTGKGIRCDAVSRFDEVNCVAGGLGMLRGRDLMALVLNWLDRSKLQGLMDTPVNQPYWPGRRKPLRLEAMTGSEK